MIQSLHIRHYGLITQLELTFGKGFNVITGETGAGKSMLLGALELLSGKRAETKKTPPGKKTVIEAVFNYQSRELEQLFLHLDLDYSDTIIVRREITPDGKSRAFVNDTPVKLPVLKNIANHLFDIHSQHQSTTLFNASTRTALLDFFAKNQLLLNEYNHHFNTYKTQIKELEILEKNIENKIDVDYLKFQLEEFEKIHPQENEKETLEAQLKTLEQATNYFEDLQEVAQIFDNEITGISEQLTKIIHLLQKHQDASPRIQDLYRRVEGLLAESQDISYETNHLLSDTDFSSGNVEEIQNRLDELYKLFFKHKVSSTKELLQTKKNIENQVEKIENSAFEVEVLSRKIKEQEAILNKIAKQLTETRKAIIPEVKKFVETQLKKVGIKTPDFQIEILPSDTFLNTGKDKVNFLFSANKGFSPQPLEKVASGGEISRIMLVLKYMYLTHKKLPTIVFDEIDTGVSGAVAEQMGKMMKEMGKKSQIIAISHLPQVAAQANEHFKVFKTAQENTKTLIQHLSEKERVFELAAMLSGEKITDSAKKNAEELLQAGKR